MRISRLCNGFLFIALIYFLPIQIIIAQDFEENSDYDFSDPIFGDLSFLDSSLDQEITALEREYYSPGPFPPDPDSPGPFPPDPSFDSLCVEISEEGGSDEGDEDKDLYDAADESQLEETQLDEPQRVKKIKNKKDLRLSQSCSLCSVKRCRLELLVNHIITEHCKISKSLYPYYCKRCNHRSFQKQNLVHCYHPQCDLGKIKKKKKRGKRDCSKIDLSKHIETDPVLKKKIAALREALRKSVKERELDQDVLEDLKKEYCEFD